MDLVRRYACGATPQEVKQRKELLCFAIWCKMQHSNSVMFQLTKKDLKERLGVGYDKAKRLINQINEDSLFTNLSNGRFIVNTFKDKEIKYNRKQETYKGALVCKMPVKKDFTLKEIYSILNNILYTFVICGAEDNSFNVDYNSVCIPMQLTTKKFMKVVNMGYGSVSRIKKQLVSRGKIKSSFAEQHVADDRIKGQKELILQRFGRKSFSYSRGHFHYLIIPCSYSIEDRRISDSFKFQIYDYEKNKYRCNGKGKSFANIIGSDDPHDNYCGG